MYMIKIKMVLALLGALLVGTVSAQIYIPPFLGRIVLIPVRMSSHAFIFLPRG